MENKNKRQTHLEMVGTEAATPVCWHDIVFTEFILFLCFVDDIELFLPPRWGVADISSRVRLHGWREGQSESRTTDRQGGTHVSILCAFRKLFVAVETFLIVEVSFISQWCSRTVIDVPAGFSSLHQESTTELCEKTYNLTYIINFLMTITIIVEMLIAVILFLICKFI